MTSTLWRFAGAQKVPQRPGSRSSLSRYGNMCAMSTATGWARLLLTLGLAREEDSAYSWRTTKIELQREVCGCFSLYDEFERMD